MSISTASLTFAQVAQHGYSAPVFVTTPTLSAPSLERQLPGSPLPCSQCGREILPAAAGTDHPSVGKIMWLSELSELPPTSLVRDSDHGLNEQAGKHLCVVAMASACGCLVFCMQVTSFGGRGIVEKYRGTGDPGEYYEQYLPLAERDTPATHSRGTLAYAGQRMKSQSYVNLDLGYWIEEQHLSTRPRSRLPLSSLETAKQAYAAAEIERQRHGGSRARERIERRKRSPSPPSQPSAKRTKRGAVMGCAVEASMGARGLRPGAVAFVPFMPAGSRARLEAIRTVSWR